MKTRIVHTKFWQDGYVSTLTVKEKLVFIYLLTNSLVELTGAYEISIKRITSDLEIAKAEVESIIGKLCEDKKVCYVEGHIVLINAKKYQDYSKGSPKQRLAYERELSLFPLSVQQILTSSQLVSNQLPTIPKSEIINQKEGGMGETKSKVQKLKQDPLPEFYSSPEFHALIMSHADFCNYHITPKTLMGYYNRIRDHEASSGKRYKDYAATIRNWLRTDIQNNKLKRFVDPTEKQMFYLSHHLTYEPDKT